MASVTKASYWSLGAVVLAGFVYSVLALSPQSAYASSCLCGAEEIESEAYCNATFGSSTLSDWVCPLGDRYSFACAADPHHTVMTPMCDE
jgi:hypothetical protein